MTYSGTGAKGRHWDDHWHADCPARARPDRHNRQADKSAWRCRLHGATGSLGAWARAALETVVWDTPWLVHTGHNEACASGPRRGWARWSGGVGACGAQAQVAWLEPSPDA